MSTWTHRVKPCSKLHESLICSRFFVFCFFFWGGGAKRFQRERESPKALKPPIKLLQNLIGFFGFLVFFLGILGFFLVFRIF